MKRYIANYYLIAHLSVLIFSFILSYLPFKVTIIASTEDPII